MADFWDDYTTNSGEAVAWRSYVDATIDSKLTDYERTYIGVFLQSWYWNYGTASAPSYQDPLGDTPYDLPAWEALDEGQRLALTIQAYRDWKAGLLTDWHWLPWAIAIRFSVGIPIPGGQSIAAGKAREADFMGKVEKNLLPIFDAPGTHRPAQAGGSNASQNPSPTPAQAAAVSAQGGSGLWLLLLLGLAVSDNK